MGGIGSGRDWYWGAKDTTGGYRSIDVRRWKREGLLIPYQSFGWQWSRDDEVVASIRVRTESDRVILTYRHRSNGEDWKDESYPVYLDWSSCHFGGQRPWFLCPARGCGRRVAILYGGGIFACRQCDDLTYQSQREDFYQRAGQKVNKIVQRLGGDSDDNCWPEKPKHMHWRTYHQLIAQAEYYDQVSSQGLMQVLAKLGKW
jgi:hypothetical protein